jgi:hypothetical protein
MKQRLRILLVVCGVGPAWNPTWAAEVSLGRLFHTPEERAALDAARRQPPTAVPETATVQSGPSAAQPAPRREGLIQRGGKPVAEWVDGALHTAPLAPARVRTP